MQCQRTENSTCCCVSRRCRAASILYMLNFTQLCTDGSMEWKGNVWAAFPSSEVPVSSLSGSSSDDSDSPTAWHFFPWAFDFMCFVRFPSQEQEKSMRTLLKNNILTTEVKWKTNDSYSLGFFSPPPPCKKAYTNDACAVHTSYDLQFSLSPHFMMSGRKMWRPKTENKTKVCWWSAFWSVYAAVHHINLLRIKMSTSVMKNMLATSVCLKLEENGWSFRSSLAEFWV